MFWQSYILPSRDENIMLEHSVRNEFSKAGKKFRKRFRVPFVFFEEICSSMEQEGYYEGGRCQNGWPRVPLELLVLGSLRVLGAGCSFDIVEEATNVSYVTHRNFFHDVFLQWGKGLGNTLIKFPKTEEEIRHVVGLFERVGHPGCVGSVDCVHIVWDKCPAGFLLACKGKEKLPTLAFQCVVSHTKKILSVSQFFAGATNDKTIARFDEAIKMVRGKDKTMREMKWSAVDGNGNRTEQTGAYFVCDGGYHKWQELIAPFKNQIDGSVESKWSKKLESVRKDVECTFGILKKRFLFLKNLIQHHFPEKIENAFVTCCALHNWLHDWDGWDDWEERGMVSSDDVMVEYDATDQHNRCWPRQSKYFGFKGNYCRSQYRREHRNAFFYDDNNNNDVCLSEYEAHDKRRSILIDHHHYMRRSGTLQLDLR